MLSHFSCKISARTIRIVIAKGGAKVHSFYFISFRVLTFQGPRFVRSPALCLQHTKKKTKKKTKKAQSSKLSSKIGISSNMSDHNTTSRKNLKEKKERSHPRHHYYSTLSYFKARKSFPKLPEDSASLPPVKPSGSFPPAKGTSTLSSSSSTLAISGSIS